MVWPDFKTAKDVLTTTPRESDAVTGYVPGARLGTLIPTVMEDEAVELPTTPPLNLTTMVFGWYSEHHLRKPHGYEVTQLFAKPSALMVIPVPGAPDGGVTLMDAAAAAVESGPRLSVRARATDQIKRDAFRRTRRATWASRTAATNRSFIPPSPIVCRVAVRASQQTEPA
jgi:hypothetical protein